MTAHQHNHHHKEESWGKRLVASMIMTLIIPAVQIYNVKLIIRLCSLKATAAITDSFCAAGRTMDIAITSMSRMTNSISWSEIYSCLDTTC